MFRVATFAKNGVYAPTLDSTLAAKASGYETVVAAKEAVNKLVAGAKETFRNGYTAYIIDQDTDRIVSVATVPEPTLEWKDTK